MSLLPLATLDESLLFGCSFVVAASRDVAAFELDQMGVLHVGFAD